MRPAYETREEFTPDGKRLVRRERTIGAIVPWAIVAIIALFTSGVLIDLPAGFSTFFK